MLISVGKLRKLVSEVATQPSPEEMARRLWSIDVVNSAEGLAPRDAGPEQLAKVVAEYAIETSLSSTRRNQLGPAYIEQLRKALIFLTMREFDR